LKVADCEVWRHLEASVSMTAQWWLDVRECAAMVSGIAA
jgi:hypothetical protein